MRIYAEDMEDAIMPLKPIFDKVPLTAMTCQPLRAGLVRMESAVMNKLYGLTAMANEPAALEGTFRLACIMTAKPGDEPVAAKIRAMLSAQKEDGSFMLSFKESVAGWEADFGKEQMTKGLAWINMSWSGDAQWAIDEAAEIGVELEYAIPQTGSTVWFDAWVIPKYAKNIKAAKYFINFMCMPENAIRNMDYIGYVSTIGGEEVLESMSDSEEFDPIDVSYFFGPEANCAHVNPVMYPDNNVIERCGMMHDCGTEDLLRMWSRVKGDSASAWTYILICLVFAGLIGAVIAKYTRKSHRRRKYSKRKTSRK